MSSKLLAKTAGGVVPISQKQTVQSTGIWERLRRVLTLDPNRSNGIPLNPWYRNPPPGSDDPAAYNDPVTAPAGDIADNPYWKRDTRRSYPKLSTFSQADVVGLLTVGSSAAPKQELIGEAGEKQLVAAKEQGQMGLAKCLEVAADKNPAKDVFVDGLPPLPSGQTMAVAGKWDVHKYEVVERSYPEGYPARSFQ